ncbi:unnamed protein product [Wuchereria bancrofti]|uniref:PH-15 domain-containing protein n=1 Tax=Wuchereria bancrofti TaxID=6293 RepID=A0A3P7EUM2_WUCBA|nr:unnamed protein product [Wuchereria bancrofti]
MSTECRDFPMLTNLVVPLEKRHNDDCISLPDQEALFSLPFVLFGHIEKKSLTVLGWRWRKRAVVLNPSGHLIIYKYFLEGIGAGKPFLGKIIHLDAAEQIHARIDKDVCYITIHDHTRKRTELRIKGTKARLWAAKVFMYEAPLNDCRMRSTAAEIEWPIERSLKLLDSKISTSSIYDITLAAKANHMEGLSKITIASLSSESFPDYTTSDASHQNTQLSAQSMERVEISEMITACEADSESSNVENTSVQNGSLIYEKFADNNFETGGLLKRSKSSQCTVTTEFSTAKIAENLQEASKSISLDQLNAVVVSRQDRFQKHFRSMIENRFYDNFKDYALNYSVSNIQNLRTQACSLRISQIYVCC